MERSRPDEILESWSAVANAATRPAAAPRRTAVRSSFPGVSLAGGGLIVVALIVAGLWLGRPGSDGGIGVVPSLDPSASGTAEPVTTPSVAPSPSPEMITEHCPVADLAARITSWEGAAGSRIATVETIYDGADPCLFTALTQVQLIDGSGAILMGAPGPDQGSILQLEPGDRVTTLVQTNDYCGGDPVAPVTLAFDADDRRFVAAPLSPTDATVPPCNSQPGAAGHIQMQPWVGTEAKIGSCPVADLEASITGWEGAAGSRIATVEMTYAGSDPCSIPSMSRVQLIDGIGAILINGTEPNPDDVQSISNVEHVTALVQVSNYCGEAPVAPVTVAFVGYDGSRVIAAPASPTDATVPPCSGAGTAAVAAMQPWTSTGTPSTTPTPVPGNHSNGLFGDCQADDLSARITMWEGAAGSRIATVEMTNNGPVACWIPIINKVQLLDGTGGVRIDGSIPTQADGLQLGKGDIATALVRTSDYCGPTPIAPISLAFWSFQGGLVTASPLSPDDATMPPCNSQSGSGQIEMQPWTR